MSFKRVIYNDSPESTFFRGVFLFVVAIVVLWFVGFWGYSYFHPKYVAVDNAAYHQSQQYTDGKMQRLDSLHDEYEEATTAEAKAVIRSTVKHEFAEFPGTNLPIDEREWLDEMRSE